uniref:Retrotransposon Copia-like N-terminal domain-containing protein n=1 Tax=Populus alba TaxID=43335 RepID=A0A4U5NR58_POPAL|nr:hypothetical protein D5086_0000246840 [Populus alba]
MVSERLIANASNDPMATTSDFSSAAFHLPAQVISIKLDGTNFLAWTAQLLPLFRSNGLMGIVDGSEFCPPQFSSEEYKIQGITNSAYMAWQYKDQTILGWIISSLSPMVVSTIYGLETSRLAWQALGACFAAPSTSRISLIKRKLQSLQQGSLPCQKFLNEVKTLADELSAVGKPIDDSDLILYVLNGLNSSFHSFVTTYMLLSKEKSMSFSDFHAELLNHDLMQQFHSQSLHHEAGSYALYSHKPAAKISSRHSSNKSRFSGVSKGSDPASCVSSSGMSPGLFFTPPSHIFPSSSDFSPPPTTSSPTQVLTDLPLHNIHPAPAINSNEYHLPSSLPSLYSGQPDSSESIPIPSAPTLSPSSDHHDNTILNLQNGALSTHESSTKIITRSQTGHHKPRSNVSFTPRGNPDCLLQSKAYFLGSITTLLEKLCLYTWRR